MRILIIVVFSMLFSGCSYYGYGGIAPIIRYITNPLKTDVDVKIENTLVMGAWKYQRQHDDCKDTNWEQTFYTNRYYKSVGAACMLPKAFSVDAENWYIKNQILYITNLSPKDGADIIIKYGISYLDENKLVLSSGKYNYTFLRRSSLYPH